MSDPDRPLITKTGRVLTEADVETLADEAERGYAVAGPRTRTFNLEIPDLIRWLQGWSRPASSCEGKVRYGHEETAAKAKEAMERKRAPKLFDAYPCLFCDGWHIGGSIHNPRP